MSKARIIFVTIILILVALGILARLYLSNAPMWVIFPVVIISYLLVEFRVKCSRKYEHSPSRFYRKNHNGLCEIAMYFLLFIVTVIGIFLYEFFKKT